MGKNSRIQKTIQDAKQKTEHFLKTKGKRFCAAMLCASMVLGNAGNLANASNVITLGESRLASPSNAETVATPSNASEIQSFKLKDKELYEALQEAIGEGRFAEAEFKGGYADEYEEFFSEPGDYYELKLDQSENKDMALRVFARVEESELLNGENDDYVIDGSEALMFLLVNQSKEDQKAVIEVNEKHTEEITVPVNVNPEEEIWAGTPSPVIDLTREEPVEPATPSDAMTATPSDSVPEELIPPEEEIPEYPEDQLQGEFYGLTGVENGTAIGFITTTGEAGLDKLELIATNSNALVRYSMPVEGAEDVVVDVTAKRGALPEGSELRARYLPEDGQEYKQAKDSLDAASEAYSGMMAMDIGFWLNEEEVEPKPGSEIQVKLRMDANLLPDDVDVGTLKVQHHEETEQGIKVRTVAKAVSVENHDTEIPEEIPTATPSDMQEEEILMEERIAEPVRMSLRSLPNEPVPVDEIISEDIGEEKELENPVEALMDTVEAELGTLRVIESGGEAAVVETAFVVDRFSKFTITWGIVVKESVTVKYVVEGPDGTLKENVINPNVKDIIEIDQQFDFSGYTVAEIGEYSFDHILLKNGDRVLLKTKSGKDIFSQVAGEAFGIKLWKLYYKQQSSLSPTYVPDRSTIYLVYKKINLFDTFKGEDTKENIKIQLFDYNEDTTQVTDKFKFGGAGYTGKGGGVEQGLVKAHLENGYPRLKEKGNKSLDCLFSRNGKYVKNYRDANYLLQYSKDDLSYYYDSNKNFASVNEDGVFSLYPTARYPDENTPPHEAKFLPYNTIYNAPTQSGGYTGYPLVEKNPNYGFGMTIEFDFIMPKGGQINGKDMVFEFQGDDDVWVFIDDVLVLDMGGVHDNYEGSINFNSGDVYVENVKGKGKQIESIDRIFKNAYDKWDKSDYKVHNLKFFYLERGKGGSNCTIQFNMPTIPSGTIEFEKNLEYANVKDSSDIDFEFKTFINQEGTNEEKDYVLYNGDYEVYNTSQKPEKLVGTYTAENGIIKLKDNQKARLKPKDSSDIKVTSKYYIQEIGATSDKFEVTFNDTKVETIYDESQTVEQGVQTGKLSVSQNPYVIFNNKVIVDNKFNLRINKVMADNSKPDKEYSIQVLLGLKDKVPYTGEYDIYEQDKLLQKNVKTDESGIIKLKPGQAAEIVGLMGGNGITVKELNLENGQAPEYSVTPKKENADGPYETSQQVDNGIYIKACEGKKLGEDPVIEVTVKNFAPPAITIKKQVEGEMGDKTKSFKFKIVATKQDNSPYPLTNYGVGEDGSFTLSHGKSLEIPELPYGVTCKVEEIIEETEGYTTTIAVSGVTDETKISKALKSVTISDMKSSAVVTFTNAKGIATPTGIFTDNFPYLMMLAMAAIGLLGFGYSRKRVKKSRDDD